MSGPADDEHDEDGPLEEGLVAIFASEVEIGAPRLSELVLALEEGSDPTVDGEEAMRLTHSLKGAARIVGLAPMVGLLHAAEDTLSAVAKGRPMGGDETRLLLELVDLLTALGKGPKGGPAAWVTAQRERIAGLATALRELAGAASLAPRPAAPVTAPSARETRADTEAGALAKGPSPASPATLETRADTEMGTALGDTRAQRVSSESLGRLLALAGESVVEARRLGASQRVSFVVERAQRRVEARAAELLRKARATGDVELITLAQEAYDDLQTASSAAQQALATTAEGLRRLLDVGEQLYIESLRVRQRPFAQIVPALRRQVRDAARSLGRSARLELTGTATLVDADVLATLEPLLVHLLTNALDHGLETEDDRAAAGKPREGSVSLALRPERGRLELTVADDGRGVDLERLREAVLAKGLAPANVVSGLGAEELLEFLFLPGFSTAGRVSVHSGRGVGLDAVRTEMKRLGGRVGITTELGKGTRFTLSLPVTRVVVRALLFRVAGEAFALPLARTGRVARVAVGEIRNAEGRDYVELDGKNVGLVRADDLLEIGKQSAIGEELTLVLLGEEGAQHGLVVDPELAEDDLLVRPLDARLSRVPDVAACAVLADGSPTLLLDADDLVRSIEKATKGHVRGRMQVRSGSATIKPPKRVLVVDDSITVREVERQLLSSRGYLVDVAVDGLDGWTALQARTYDALVVDVDMPRLDGLELTARIRRDPGLAKLPIVIVSYKERPEDRARGMAAGADQYLAKSSFHDNQLVDAVRGLIGEAS